MVMCRPPPTPTYTDVPKSVGSFCQIVVAIVAPEDGRADELGSHSRAEGDQLAETNAAGAAVAPKARGGGAHDGGAAVRGGGRLVVGRGSSLHEVLLHIRVPCWKELLDTLGGDRVLAPVVVQGGGGGHGAAAESLPTSPLSSSAQAQRSRACR